MKNKILVTLLSLYFSISLNAQIVKPNIGVKSHPTLVVEKIERILKMTVVELSIKCELEQGGWFCADKNIILKDPLSKLEYKVQRSENIPICPQQHHFKRKGEILRFKLYFPEIPSSIKYLDLIEMCNDACFYVKGIVLSPGFNAEIEMAYYLYSKGKLADAASAFQQLTISHADYPYGIYYFQAIKTYSEIKDKMKTSACINKLKQADIKDKTFYLESIAKNKYGEN